MEQLINLIFKSVDSNDFEMFTCHINKLFGRSEVDNSRVISTAIIKRRIRNNIIKPKLELVSKLMTIRDTRDQMTLLEKSMHKLFESNQSIYLLYLFKEIPNISLYLY